MKMKYAWAGIFALALVASAYLEAQASMVFTIPVSEDSWVSQTSPGSNYGSSGYLTVKDAAGIGQIYLQFSDESLKQLSGTVILSATLYAYQYAGAYTPGDDISAHRVMSDWSADSLTWNNKPAFDTQAPSALALLSGTNAWRKWEGLEGIVAWWLGKDNYGLVLENSSDAQLEELNARFYSSDYATLNKRPYLEVVAEALPETLPKAPLSTATVPEPASIVLYIMGIGAIGIGKVIKVK